ncbi:hypothetical protein EQM14_08220 [Caproiciproducens sp. NJN-50]|uniref:hypothetical protein n=1 Tax=Acutalibacteraceae TaxID=3082771 RepID=UPI000FFE132F|nr:MULTISPECIES: hypothetical protein [Acutalibacteraceae]QAT49760.1 hypothetical protein EQM14_08220 [Caproiciproducens sp. NJN-50]
MLALLIAGFESSCSAKAPFDSEPVGSVSVSSSQPDHGQQASDSLREEKFIAYLSRCDCKSGTVAADRVEWVTASDQKRMEELHLTQDDMPDGFYIYNSKKETNPIEIAKDAKISIFRDTSGTPFQSDLNGLADRISASSTSVFWLTIQNGVASAVEEQYLP